MKNEEFVDDVLRKVGRNVVLFQQLERLLKFVIANSNLAGFSSELRRLKQEQESKVHKQTLGTLVGQYSEISSPDSNAQSTEPEDLHETFISFSFRIERDEDCYESQKEILAQLVSDRNDLIHHLLPRFDINSAESCETLSEELDQQAEKIRLEINTMQSTAEALYKGREKLGSYLQSEQCKNEIELAFIRQSRLVLILSDIATQISREDGWALMSTAGHIIKQHAPEELESMKEKYGYNSLMKLIQASELFDLYEEVTPKGGSRILYRLKPNKKPAT